MKNFIKNGYVVTEIKPLYIKLKAIFTVKCESSCEKESLLLMKKKFNIYHQSLVL